MKKIITLITLFGSLFHAHGSSAEINSVNPLNQPKESARASTSNIFTTTQYGYAFEAFNLDGLFSLDFKRHVYEGWMIQQNWGYRAFSHLDLLVGIRMTHIHKVSSVSGSIFFGKYEDRKFYKSTVDTFSAISGIYIHTNNLIRLLGTCITPYFGACSVYSWENSNYSRSQFVYPELDMGLRVTSARHSPSHFSLEIGSKTFLLFPNCAYIGLRGNF